MKKLVSVADRRTKHPQTIAAYEIDRSPIACHPGSPLRLRVETKRGFKTVKCVKSIELVEKEHDHEKKKIV